MSITIEVPESKAEEVIKQHGNKVYSRLKQAISQKNETLRWKSTPEACTCRFGNTVYSDGELFPEIYFSAGGQNYRAVLCFLEKYEIFTLLTVVAKRDKYIGSEQFELFRMIEANASEVVKRASQEAAAMQEPSPLIEE